MNFQDIIREVYDRDQNLLRTSGGSGSSTVFIGTPTLHAVVNTAAAGQASVVIDRGHAFIGIVTIANPQTTNTGNITLNASSAFIGIVTVTNTVPVNIVGAEAPVDVSDGGSSITVDGSVGIVGNVTLSDPKGFIGLVTVVGSLSPAAGNVTLDPGSKTGIVGNVTLSDAKTYIGLTTATIGNAMVTVTLGTALDSTNDSVSIGGTLPAGPNFIGLTTTTLGASPAFVGIVTVTNRDRTITGNVTLSDAKTFIGLVTAQSINNGTNKTLVQLPVGLGLNSLATVAVPTNAQKIKVTSLILNSNVTTEIALKSGVTYLTGNASLGITLFPGGGFVLPGSPDSPQWISLPSGALVVEKRDPGGTVSKIGGHAIYFDEA